MQDKQYYITTPIYYVNDVPHIGHAYTTIAADTLARYKRLDGYRTFLLTGTDEHGQKVERTALQGGETPQELADRVVERFKALWRRLGISNDDFIRTTEPRHKRGVAAFFERVYANGDIYLGDYEGWYCTFCETFWTDTQLTQGNCPDCQRPTERLKEKSYFFRMSKYQDRLLRHYEEHPEFIQPASRRNEIVSFVKSGLRDLSISRTSFRWGIPVPNDASHVIYVWFDALANYLTALDYGGDGERFRIFWPADVHLIGKDILRFHSVYWPTFLMSAGLPLPRKVFGHGWWTVEGQKMSKSLQNVVDPNRLADEYGVDPVRYFVLREVSFGLDGDFSHAALVHRINSDLANDLGNLHHRILNMIKRYTQQRIPAPSTTEPPDEALRDQVARTLADVETALEQLAFDRALRAIWDLVGATNKYLDGTAPWSLAKQDESRTRLGTVLYHGAEVLRVISILISPFMPNTAKRMWEHLGQPTEEDAHSLRAARQWGLTEPGRTTHLAAQLFPRIEEERKIEAPGAADVASSKEETMKQISLEQFEELDLRVGEVVAAERVAKSKKLLKLEVDIGTERRTVVAGLAEDYAPEELLGKRVILLTNLAPATLMGLESQGMLLAADSPTGVVIATFDLPVKAGAKVR